MEVAKLKIHGAEKELIVDKENDYLLSDQYYWRAIKRNCGNHVYYTVQGYKRGGEMMGRSHKLFYIHRLIMGSPKGMTIDHILPRSKGGKSEFENTVCCCFACNNKKDNRTPSEAKMFLKFRPYTPTIMEFLIRSIKNSGMEETLNELEKLGVL